MVFRRLGKKINGLAVKLGLKKSSQQQRLNSKTNPPKNTAQNQMSDDEKLSANIAENVYNKDRTNFGDYEYQSEHSDSDRGVWHNKKTKKTRIGYKGTNTLKDVFTDTADPRGNILSGTQRNNPQYKKDLEHFDKVSSIYGRDIALSGHSLGGSRTYNVSKEKNVMGHAFNTGRGKDKQMMIDKAKCNTPKPPKWCDKMTSLRIRGDPLSVANKLAYGKHKTFNTGGLKSHLMGNFQK